MFLNFSILCLSFFLSWALWNFLLGSFSHPSYQLARVCYKPGSHEINVLICQKKRKRRKQAPHVHSHKYLLLVLYFYIFNGDFLFFLLFPPFSLLSPFSTHPHPRHLFPIGNKSNLDTLASTKEIYSFQYSPTHLI